MPKDTLDNDKYVIVGPMQRGHLAGHEGTGRCTTFS